MKISLFSKESWMPQDIVLENAALNTVKANRNTLVIAGPGAGKTELLAQRACFLLQTNTCTYPKRVLAVSFKKDAASNLAERIQKRCGKDLANRFESMTFDSFAKEILDRFYLSLPTEYRPAKDYAVDTNHKLLKRAFEIAGHHNIYISPSDARPKIPQNVMRIMLSGSAEHEFQPALTFNLISRLADYLLKTNPAIIKALQATYSHIFLDEFQDITGIQYDLVKTCFLGSKSIITAVGDGKQRIMVWAGALPNAFELFMGDFAAQEETLVVNHRSAPKLIAMQRSLYRDLNSTLVDIVPSEKWKPDEGIATINLFSTQEDEASFLKSRIKTKLDEGISPRDICVLTKHSIDDYCAFFIGPILETGYSMRNEGIYQDLLKEDLVKILYATLYCSLAKDNADAFIYLQEIDLLLKSIEMDDDNKVMTQLQQLTDIIDNIELEFRKITTATENGHSDFIKIVSMVINYFGEKSIRDFFPQYQNGSYFEDVRDQFVELIWQEYISIGNWLKAFKTFEGENSVSVMTIHKSKGLEYEVVFFVGLEDNSFFSFTKQKDEDLCTFFVAISRAKKELIITKSDIRTTLKRNSGVQDSCIIQPIYDAINASGVVEIIDQRAN